jgi:Flp pilus assembly pilin Flp
MPAIRPPRGEKGQGLVEYALLLAVASLGTVLALVVLRDSLGDTLRSTGSRIDQVTAAAPSDPPAGTDADEEAAGGEAAPESQNDGGGRSHGNGKGNSGNGKGNGGPNGRKN